VVLLEVLLDRSPAQIDAAAVPATMGDLGGAVAEIGSNAKELSRRL